MLELYRRLLQPGGFVSPALDCVDFDCDKRTLQRDVAVLREVLGDELEHVEDVGLGWLYRLTAPHKWQVEPSQVLAIVAGARATQFVSGRRFSNEIQPILEQLRSSLRHGDKLQLRRVEQKVYVTRTGEKRYDLQTDKQEFLALLVDGLMLQTAVQLAYLSHGRASKGEAPLDLVVLPLSIVFHRGGVYFVAEVIEGDMPAKKRISLALDRIHRAVPRDDFGVLDYPADFSADEFFSEAFRINLSGPLQKVVLRVSPFMKPFVLERFWSPSEEFEEEPDGSLRVTLEVRGDIEILEWISGMGQHAEILRPARLRAAMRERLRGALALYGHEA